MSQEHDPRPDSEETPADERPDVETLQARIQHLIDENNRLRRRYARTKRTKYRRSAIGLALVGLIAGGGALLFPSVRSVLIALAGTGLFAAVLIYYLTPEHFVPASVGGRIYQTFHSTHAALIAELGLQDERIYIPVQEDEGTPRNVRLFVPQQSSTGIPASTHLNRIFVIGDGSAPRGLSVPPIGDELYDEFVISATTDVADDPPLLVEQLAEAVTEVFELAATATPEYDHDGNRCSIAITGSRIDRPDRFDHPIASLFATGLARVTGKPIAVKITDDDDRSEYIITCRWGLTD